MFHRIFSLLCPYKGYSKLLLIQIQKPLQIRFCNCIQTLFLMLNSYIFIYHFPNLTKNFSPNFQRHKTTANGPYARLQCRVFATLLHIIVAFDCNCQIHLIFGVCVGCQLANAAAEKAVPTCLQQVSQRRVFGTRNVT